MLDDFIEETYGAMLGKGKAKRQSTSADGYHRGVQTGNTLNHKSEIRGSGGTKLLN